MKNYVRKVILHKNDSSSFFYKPWNIDCIGLIVLVLLLLCNINVFSHVMYIKKFRKRIFVCLYFA